MIKMQEIAELAAKAFQAALNYNQSFSEPTRSDFEKFIQFCRTSNQSCQIRNPQLKDCLKAYFK